LLKPKLFPEMKRYGSIDEALDVNDDFRRRGPSI
jgi:hypothetical protein